MTMPLLVGLDGTMKMSKSLGNYVGVTETSRDMFGKIMSIPDNLMESYFNLLTGIELRVVSEDEEMHPKAAKMKLAKLIVASYYGDKVAAGEADNFDKVFSKKEAPENPDELSVPEKEIWIVDLLKRAGAATSTSEARRLIEQGAVSIDGEKVSDFNLKWMVKKNSLVKAGKKKFVKII